MKNALIAAGLSIMFSVIFKATGIESIILYYVILTYLETGKL